MRRIFIVRHGNTFASGDTILRVGARTDLPLVESGRAQAAALATHFAGFDMPVRRLLCGPLQRARETAALIGAATGSKPEGHPAWLDEIDHGPDEGQPEEAVLARVGAEALADWDRNAIAPPDWIVDAPVRIAGWRAFFAESAGGVDLLVTSNGAARFALIAAGLPAASLKLRTGAYGELAVEGKGSVRLLRWDVRPGDLA
ncbi:MAG: histidine phosphatase family protein [Sphingobium sp.]